jgi:hypothetical protein
MYIEYIAGPSRRQVLGGRGSDGKIDDSEIGPQALENARNGLGNGAPRLRSAEPAYPEICGLANGKECARGAMGFEVKPAANRKYPIRRSTKRNLVSSVRRPLRRDEQSAHDRQLLRAAGNRVRRVARGALRGMFRATLRSPAILPATLQTLRSRAIPGSPRPRLRTNRTDPERRRCRDARPLALQAQQSNRAGP